MSISAKKRANTPEGLIHLRRIAKIGGILGGKIQGKRNAESGQMQKLGKIYGKIYGKINGRIQGRKNVKSGQLKRVTTEYREKRKKEIIRTGKKRCPKCNLLLSINKFTKDGEEGFSSWCKKCKTIYDKEYRKKNKERLNNRRRNYRKKIRMKALMKISRQKLACMNCGCDNPRLLEINHKNGGGYEEIKSIGGSTQFYLNIINGKRKTDDLNILCKVCNNLHYLELKYGKLPYKIIWQGPGY